LRNPPGVAEAQATSGTPAQLLGEEYRAFHKAGFLPGEARRSLCASGDRQIPSARGGRPGADRGISEASSAFVDLATAADPTAAGMQVRVAGGAGGMLNSCLGDGTRLQEVTGCAANAPDCAGAMPSWRAVRVGLRLSDSTRNSPDDTGGSRLAGLFQPRASGDRPAGGLGAESAV